jgi:hypothetical protein
MRALWDIMLHNWKFAGVSNEYNATLFSFEEWGNQVAREKSKQNPLWLSLACYWLLA